jgi:hypothetical protein
VARPRLLIVGDSVAHSLAQGAALLGDSINVDVANGAESGCNLTDDVTAMELTTPNPSRIPLAPPCVPVWRAAFERFQPDEVLVVFGSAFSFHRVMLDGEWVKACDPAYQRWHRGALAAVLSEFAAKGATVHISTLPYHVGAWLPDDSRKSIDCMNELNASVVELVPGARSVDLGGFVCPKGDCIAEVRGEPVRIDGVHFTATEHPIYRTKTGYKGAGSAWAAAWLIEQVAPTPRASSAG